MQSSLLGLPLTPPLLRGAEPSPHQQKGKGGLRCRRNGGYPSGAGSEAALVLHVHCQAWLLVAPWSLAPRQSQHGPRVSREAARLQRLLSHNPAVDPTDLKWAFWSGPTSVKGVMG